MERLETEMREMADTQRKIMQCFRRKAESRARDPSLRELRRSGKNLDLTRLPQAYIASRTGTPARLFRRTVEGRQPIFDPSRHVVLYAFDINSLVSAGPGQPAWNRRAIAITASVFKQLDVPIVMIAFADRLVRVANKQYYLHVTTRIKSLDEPWGYGVWNRLIHSCRPKAWNLPGKPAAYHPLQMQTLASELETIDLQDDFVNRTVMYTSVRGMPPVKPFRSPEFLQLTAGHLDHQLKQLEVRYESDGIDLDFLYIPQDLKIQAPRGSRVAKMQTLS